MGRIKGFKVGTEINHDHGARYTKTYEGHDNCVEIVTCITIVDQNFGRRHYNIRVMATQYKADGDTIIFNHTNEWIDTLAEARKDRSRLLEVALEMIDKRGLR